MTTFTKLLGAACLALALTAVGASSFARADEATHEAAHEASEAASHESATPEGEGHEGGEHAARIESPLRLLASLVNFAGLAFILVKFGGSAVKKGLASRHTQLKTDISQAAEAKAAAEARYKAQEARLAGLEQEIATLRAKMKAEAEAEKSRLLAAAEERAARVREETRFLLEQQTKEAAQVLRREAALAAVKVAEEILRRQVGGTDQQRLLDAFVKEVATADRRASEITAQGGAD